MMGDRMYLMARLDRLGHEVVGAANGMEALEAFGRFNPDLVLLDVVMPVMDGLETARRLRALEDDDRTWVPIIFLSQRTEDADIAAGIDAGGDDYLTKPVSDIVLSAKMHAMQRIAAMRSRQIELAASLMHVNKKLLHLAQIDGLTGLPNRRRLDDDLAREWDSCARFRQPLALVMTGIDRLRDINERHDYLTGDDCVRQVAAFLESQVDSPPDLVARHSGGKFCILLPDSPASTVADFAEHLRREAASLDVPGVASLTLSIGISVRVPESDGAPDYLLREAHERLRQAKRAGGDRVI